MRFAAILLAAVVGVDPFGWDHFGPLRFALISTLSFVAIAVSFGAGDDRSQPLPRWSVIGWVSVMVGLAVSTILSEDSWHALIGTPERHLGLATWFLFVGLFAVASMYPFTIQRPLVGAAIASTIIAGLWSIAEVFDVGWFTSSFADDRTGGPLGQPAFLGAAMVLISPVAWSAAVDNARSALFRSVSGIAGTLGIVALALSQSRAAWVAALIAVAAWLIQRRLWKLGAVVAVVVVAAIAFTPIGERAGTLTNVDDGVVAGRLDEWQVGARAAVDTPTFGVTGHGPEGYRTVFGRHVDEAYVMDYGRVVITDRAHNSVLDMVLSGGLIAGAGMLLLHVGLAITSLQRLRAADPFDVALSMAVLGYVLQQIFLFPLAELDPVLWIFAGLLVARRPRRIGYPPPLFRTVSGSRRLVMLGAGFLAAMSSIAGLSDVAADHAVADVVDADGAAALRNADIARSRRPDSIRYDFIAARAALRSTEGDGLNTALERLDDGLGISPTDPAFAQERAAVLLEIARRSDDEGDLAAALAAFEDLEVSDPNHPASELGHGIALALAGDIDRARAEFTHASLLAPTSVDALINLAVLEFEAENLDAGRALLDKIDALAPTNAQAENLRREFLSE